MKRYLLILICVLCRVGLVSDVQAQVHFNNCLSRTAESATVLIPASASPKLGDQPLASGDEIAIMAPNGTCVGATVWNGSSTAITAWASDEYSTTGLKPGEEMHFVVWDASAQKEYRSISKTYSKATPVFRADSLYAAHAIYELSAFSVLTHLSSEQIVSLQQGWNIISGYVKPSIQTMDAVFAPVRDQLTLVKDETGKVYMPDYGINQIGNWDVTRGYRVYIEAPGSIKLSGALVQPEQTPIALRQGWNLVSFLRTSPLTAPEALGVLGSKLTIAKNNDGGVYLPEHQYDSIGNLVPGEGYFVYLSTASVFTYPSNNGAAASKAGDLASFNGQFPEGNGVASSANLLIQAPWGKDGDVITAWHGERQIASAPITDSIAVVMLVGDDLSTPGVVEGLAHGDVVSFKLERDLGAVALELQNIQDLVSGTFTDRFEYTNDAVYIAQAVTGTATDESEIPQEFKLEQNYPNPFNPSTTIRYQLASEAQVNIEVYNMLGQRIRTLVGERQKAGFYTIEFDASDLPSGTYLYRLRAGQHVESRPMLLVK